MIVIDQLTYHVLYVEGDFACFTRPEMKVERYSYPCPTPSAARGIFEAIYFKPQFYWQVTRIELLEKPSLLALRRNEVMSKLLLDPKQVEKWISGDEAIKPIFSDQDEHTQRQTMALREPKYRLTARIVPRPGQEQQQKAYDEQFVRRASQGKCFYQPCLGCREFVAYFRYLDSLENEKPPVDYSQKIGWMLYDVFDLSKSNNSFSPPFISVFDARIENGVLEVPPFDNDLVKKPGERRAG